MQVSTALRRRVLKLRISGFDTVVLAFFHRGILVAIFLLVKNAEFTTQSRIRHVLSGYYFEIATNAILQITTMTYS